LVGLRLKFEAASLCEDEGRRIMNGRKEGRREEQKEEEKEEENERN
jgi:hypothetical protein